VARSPWELAALLYSSASGMDALPESYPLQDAPVSDTELLRHLRARQGPVLELPSWDPAIGKPGLRANAVAMYRATEHWRPLLNGYSSYWPAGYLGTHAAPRTAYPAPTRSADSSAKRACVAFW
jgi:hypothetical protein